MALLQAACCVHLVFVPPVVLRRLSCCQGVKAVSTADPSPLSHTWRVCKQIQMEQRKLALVELKAKDLTDKLNVHMDSIKSAGGINSAQDKAIALHKEIKRLESRRQQASIKYNEAITHNQKLRAQIDSLRRERLVFDGIYKKLEKELQVRALQLNHVSDWTILCARVCFQFNLRVWAQMDCHPPLDPMPSQQRTCYIRTVTPW